MVLRDIAYRASRKTPLVSSGLVTITTKYTDNGLLCGVPFSGAAKEMCEKANQARITSSQELLDQVYAALMEQVWYLPLWEEKSLVGADPSSQDVYMDVSLRTFPNSCYFADDYNVYYTDK